MLETAQAEAVLLDRRYLTIAVERPFAVTRIINYELFPVLATTSVFSMMPLGRLVSKLLGLIKRLQKCQTF